MSIHYAPLQLVLQLLVISFFVLACKGKPLPTETKTRENFQEVSEAYRPQGVVLTLPQLTEKSRIEDFLYFGLSNNPKIEIAYYQWAMSVEQISVARSRPDPRLTFSLDIGKMVSSVMVGLMTEIPGPGKLRIAGDMANLESRKKYFDFAIEVLETVYDIKSAYFQMEFYIENLRLKKEYLQLLEGLDSLVLQQNATGRSVMQDALQIKIEVKKLQNEIDNLKDFKIALLAKFKATLGLGVHDDDPPIPEKFDRSIDAFDRAEILKTVLESNPKILQLMADVERAQVFIQSERKKKTPDFSVGIEADVKANPIMVSPSVEISLPIWRDKISASIASAQFEKHSLASRLNAESIKLATELAIVIYSYDESVRNRRVLVDELIPKSKELLALFLTSYANDKSNFVSVVDGYKKILELELALSASRLQQEMALATLSRLIASKPLGADFLLQREQLVPESQKMEVSK